MPRKPVSEREFKERLEGEGWSVMPAPASLGAVDLLAFMLGFDPSIRDLRLFKMRGYEVKETRKDVLYLSDSKLEQMREYEEGTGVPVFLAVKFKARQPLRGEKPVWKVLKPRKKVEREESGG